jgi:hypothetical protein
MKKVVWRLKALPSMLSETMNESSPGVVRPELLRVRAKPSIRHPLKRWKYVRDREVKIAELRRYVDQVYQEETSKARWVSERDAAQQRVSDRTRFEAAEAFRLEQEDLWRGLKTWALIPAPEHLAAHWESFDILSAEGERWARKTITETRRTWVEAWGRALGPYMSAATAGFSAIAALMSALATWIALHRR